MKTGYQLYSARNEAAADLFGTLKALSDMGYDGIELAGLYGNSVETVKQALDDAGLTAVSAHVPLKEIEADMFRTISDYKALGCRYIAVPYTDETCRPGGPGFAAAIALMWKFGRLCREAGIQLLYHNHDFEFVNISGMYGLDFIYSAVDSETLKTEIDTCWAKYAGVDPAAYVRSYTGRAPVVHLKDYVGVKGGKTPYALIGIESEKADPSQIAFEFRPVGSGCQDVAGLIQAARDAGSEWLIVEQDESVGRTPLEAAKMSIDYIKKLI